MSRGVLITALALALAVAVLAAVYHAGHHGAARGSDERSLVCNVRVELNVSSGGRVAGLWLVYMNSSGLYIHSILGGATRRLDVQGEVSDAAPLGDGRGVVLLCGKSGGAVVLRVLVLGQKGVLESFELPSPFESIDECISAYMVWAGDERVFFPRQGLLLDIGRRALSKANVTGELSLNGTRYVLVDALWLDGARYAVYQSVVPVGGGARWALYVVAEHGGRRHSYLLSLNGTGTVGFVVHRSRVYLYVVSIEGLKGSLLSIYDADTGRLVCRRRLGYLIAFSPTRNYGDIDGDGRGDIVIFASNSPESRSVALLWVELR